MMDVSHTNAVPRSARYNFQLEQLKRVGLAAMHPSHSRILAYVICARVVVAAFLQRYRVATQNIRMDVLNANAVTLLA